MNNTDLTLAMIDDPEQALLYLRSQEHSAVEEASHVVIREVVEEILSVEEPAIPVVIDKPVQVIGASSSSSLWNWMPTLSFRSQKHDTVIADRSAAPKSGWFSGYWSSKPIEAKIPFDEGRVLQNRIKTDGFHKQMMIEDKATLVRMGQYSTVRTLDIDGTSVRWSSILESDIHRMVGNGQLYINDKLVAFPEGAELTEKEKAEIVVAQIYALTGNDEEVTFRISGIMCQSATNFLFHSAARHLTERFHLTPIYAPGHLSQHYHLYANPAEKSGKPEVFLTAKLTGGYPSGVFEIPGGGTEFAHNPGTLKSKAHINFSEWQAHVNYQAKLTEAGLETFTRLTSES